jgi:hypothetical protein
VLRGAAAAAFGLLPTLAAGPLPAQDACTGRTIREIRVTTQSLFGIEDEPFPPVVQRVANSLHWRTRPRMVARDLLFHAGDRCDPRRLEESERLLRNQGYIRLAAVTAVAAPGGETDIEVLTRDDWTIDGSLSFDPSRSGAALRRLRLGEDNLLGRGMRAAFRYRNVEREPGFEVEVIERHFLRGRRDATFVAGHSGVGPVAEQIITRSFETEFDRIAWREATRYRRDPFTLSAPGFLRVFQPVVTEGADLGIARRFGEPGRLRLVGLVLTGERRASEGVPRATRSADDSAAVALLSGRFAERRVLRANLLLGARALRFSRIAGADAVNALEDVREGIELGMVAGRSLGRPGRFQEDWFLAAELFAGGSIGARTRLFVRAKVEGRRLDDAAQWDGVIGSGEFLGYLILGTRSSAAFTAGGAGGWRTSTPFQLELAGPFGVRGYGSTGFPVGRRVVARGEHRYFAGTVLGAVDVGTAGFVDAGRGWAGGAAFGGNTGIIASVGAGLRFGFPSGSRRVYRLDVALPLRQGFGPELRLGFGQQFGITRDEADDVVRSRETISSATVFNFPRF